MAATMQTTEHVLHEYYLVLTSIAHAIGTWVHEQFIDLTASMHVEARCSQLTTPAVQRNLGKFLLANTRQPVQESMVNVD